MGNCLHLQGLRRVSGTEFRCPACEARLGLGEVERWMREAEQARDEAYLLVEGDRFGQIAREESQREVYRRRRVLYELQSTSWMPTARPEMILVVYDARESSYECRIFYKEPRPIWGLEQFSVEAATDAILKTRAHPDPVIRLVSEKVEEFHNLRERMPESGLPVPARWVFYANEL